MISMIAAHDRNRLIGRDNDMPWHLPADLAFFKKTTMGHPVLMGRKTYESIGRPLPGRRNLVLTTDETYEAPGCTVIHSLDELGALNLPADEEVFVIGGAQIYRALLPVADRLYLTEIDAAFEGDTYFPEVLETEWMRVSEHAGVVDEQNCWSHTFVVWERRK
jgi:dihydrofolate reductase